MPPSEAAISPMCGITGIFKFGEGHVVEESVLQKMCEAMVHRGPDDHGFHTDDGVGLGMQRLSIIDVVSGHQPISNEDGSTWIVFNGEIYNHLALRAELIAMGHRFRTHSDTETIVHLYEEFGRDCVKHLRGMFAFAIWDGSKRCLFVARDRLGIKPLYYRASSESFIFGSEIKAILACPGLIPQFNRTSLPEYLAFGYLSGPQTFYTGVQKLMPGHWVEVDEHGTLRLEKYWDLSAEPDGSTHDESYYADTYRTLFEDAVRSHLMSDVPVGVFLSGGLDSSAVAAMVTSIRGSTETFSVGYSEQAFSELPYARVVAKHLNSVHREVVVSDDDFFEALPKLIWHEDEPIAWPSSVALYFVARLARESVKVVLTGEGSDETLAGYTRYAFTEKNANYDRFYRSLIPEKIRRAVREYVSNVKWMGSANHRKLAHTFLARDGSDWTSFYFDNFFSAFSAQEQVLLLDDSVAADFSEGQSYSNVLGFWNDSTGSSVQRMLYTDIKTYLVELLMKQDNMSMAASVESRVPFLDHKLVEFAMRIPQNLLIRGLAGKGILKKAVQDLLPPSIVQRRKLGFPTPWSGWLAGSRLDWIQGILEDKRSTARGFFKMAAVRQIFEEHRSGRRDHSNRIWRLLNLELWHRVCLEGDYQVGVSICLPDFAAL